MALDACDAERDDKQQQQAVLVGEDFALVIGFHRPLEKGSSLSFGVARAQTRGDGAGD
jgi:hypothetical protein